MRFRDEAVRNDLRVPDSYHQEAWTGPHFRLYASAGHVSRQRFASGARFFAYRRGAWSAFMTGTAIFPPASPQISSEQTDVAKARTGTMPAISFPGAAICRKPGRPMPIFYVESRYQGTKLPRFRRIMPILQNLRIHGCL